MYLFFRYNWSNSHHFSVQSSLYWFTLNLILFSFSLIIANESIKYKSNHMCNLSLVANVMLYKSSYYENWYY